MAYIGQSIKNGTFTVLDTSGNTYNGSNTTFTLGTQVGSAAQLLVSHDGVIQKPGTDYTLSSGGAAITFTTAPASGASIFIVEISGAIGGPMNRDLNGEELILDVDGDTSLHASTDDQIDFKAGGSDIATINASGLGLGTTSPSAQLHIQGSDITDQVLIENTNAGAETAPDLTLYRNSSSPADSDTLANIIFRGKNDAAEDIDYFSMTGVIADASDGSEDTKVEFATKSAGSNATVMTFKSNKVGIGEDVPEGTLHVMTSDAGVGPNANGDDLIVENNDNCGMSILSSNDGYGSIMFGDNGDDDIGQIRYDHTNNNMSFIANTSEAMRINSNGDLLVGKTSAGNSVQGIEATNANGDFGATRTNAVPMVVNRLGNDGDLVLLRHATSTEGTIAVSGSTVSYNGFTGTHWSRLADNSKPTILKGTILESLDAMVDWYQIKFTVTDKEAKDENGDLKTYEFKEDYALKDGESVGDVITHTHDGVDLPATIEKEKDIKHAQCKVSDSAESKSVYGAFVDWDNDSMDTVNDILVAQVGTFVIRVHKDETVAKGDLIQSKGDGTGKVQADDIIRASTVAKVLSTTKIETYSDGSYIVPCSLHC